MDLIYADSNREDVGVLHDYAFDLAIGADENDFELTVDQQNHVCRAGYYLYIEGTEYGGVVDSVKVKTAVGEVTYKGRTWHGILASKIIEPDVSQAHLVLSGEANELIAFLIVRMGLAGLFVASTEMSGLEVEAYEMNRYVNGYIGIVKMLASAGGKLKFCFKDSMVKLSAEPFVDYSEDEQFDADQVDLEIEKCYRPINHVICLGKGELENREVIHVYGDGSGGVGRVQSLYGLDEVMGKYDNPNAESSEELEQGGVDMILEAYAGASKVSMSFDNEESVYDIGDIIGAQERITGIQVAEKITKKIVTIDNGKIDIEYKVGD